MGFPFWKNRQTSEKSEGGSIIYRHGGNEFSKPTFGFPEESTLGFLEARETVYKKFFGSAKEVFHELIPMVPHIDVYVYPTGYKSRDFFTLVTGGMSDMEMTLPTNATGAASRVELIFYCSDPKKEYMEMLRRLAHFPHDNKTWLGNWHTMPNGQPPARLWDSNSLDSFLFMPTIVKPDSTLEKELVLNGSPVHFLWLVPISTPECDFKLKKGAGALLDLFSKYNHPPVFDPKRNSYI